MYAGRIDKEILRADINIIITGCTRVIFAIYRLSDRNPTFSVGAAQRVSSMKTWSTARSAALATDKS
jgi:hypothetical protein